MPAMLVAAALAAAAPQQPSPPACQPVARQEAAAAARAAPHPLADEPATSRMHAVLREIGGCVVVDVAATHGAAGVWEYRLAGPANAWPRPAAAGR